MYGKKRFNQRGFTFIELMVVIVILSIVMSVNTPRLSRFYHSVKLNSTTRSLQILLNHGRSQAIHHRSICEVRIDRDWRRLSLWRQVANNGRKSGDDVRYEKVFSRAASFELPMGIQLTAIVQNDQPLPTGSEQHLSITPSFNRQETILSLVGKEGGTQHIKMIAGSGRAVILEADE